MKLQALDHLVDEFALGMKGKPGEVEAVGCDRGDRGAIVDIIESPEQVARKDRRQDAAVARPVQAARELFLCRGKDQDRLAHQRSIGAAGSVAIALAHDLRVASGKAATQKGGDIQFLPGSEVLPHDNGDLSVEGHGDDPRAQG